MATNSKLKIAGVWSGILEVDLEGWTVPMLRAEVAKRSAKGRPAECVKMISGGKVIQDFAGGVEGGVEGKKPLTLREAGLAPNSKVLASSADPAPAAQAREEERRHASLEEEEKRTLASEEERARRLARIRSTAEKLSARHSDGSLPTRDYNIELEDQNGQKLNLPEVDQRGVMTGLMLHANGKSLMKRGEYKDALDVLLMGEEAFSLCDPRLIAIIDNVPMLQLDVVWCYFVLRDVSRLSDAGSRLASARRGFERTHGKDFARLRMAQSGLHAELALYVRLELLEGVVAYHAGELDKARQILSSAKSKHLQLQVSDESLSLLMGMGYSNRAAKRALRMTGQDINGAVEFLVEEKARAEQRMQEDARRQMEIMEQKSYGVTPLKKAVEIRKVDELSAIGFERPLAAEALRVNENDFQKALDDLTNPDANSKLQLQMEQRRRRRQLRAAQAATGGGGGGVDPAPNAEEATGVLPSAAAAGSNGEPNAAGSGQEAGTNPNDDDQQSPDQINDHVANDDVDAEMEDVIAHELSGDALADYDIEVAQEGEAIAEYLALLELAAGSSAPDNTYSGQ